MSKIFGQARAGVVEGTAVVIGDGHLVYAGPLQGLRALISQLESGEDDHAVLLNPVDFRSFNDFMMRKALN